MGLSWVIPQTVPTPYELQHANSSNTRHLNINRYRSRTEVTDFHINAAYTWLRLPVVNDDNTAIMESEYKDKNWRYTTQAIRRGVSPEQAVEESKALLEGMKGSYVPFHVVMFNTSTAAAATEAFKTYLDDSEEWESIDVSTIATIAPTHKVFMYKWKFIDEEDPIRNRTIFAILNNVDTPQVVFKLAAAIMLNINPFTERTTMFAEAYMTGNGDTICNLIINYYKAYRDNKEKMWRAEALENMSKAISVDRTSEFKRRMDNAQNEINNLYTQLQEKYRVLNAIKGEYLLYNLEDENSKGEELKRFFESCGNKVTYIKFTNKTLYIVYRTQLVYFESNLLQRYFDTPRNNCVNSSPDYIKQLLKDVFIEQKYNYLIESGVALNIETNTVAYRDPASLKSISSTELLGLPNPHHAYYNCWGDNQPNIIRALENKDYITAITTAFAAMSGLNIADTAVIEKFVREEIPNYRGTQCLQDRVTGEVITIQEYQRRYEDNAANETNEQTDTGSPF